MRCLLLALCLLLWPVTALADLKFAVIGDPQLGFGKNAEFGDQSRFEQVVHAVNQSPAELALIVGDLVQDRTWLQHRLFVGAHAELRPKTLLVAGNHDVVDLDTLTDYRASFGPDYYDHVQGNVAFVIVNSETARDHSLSVSEYTAQWDFIEKSLSKHVSAGHRPIVLAMHRPPFVDDEREPETPANWPPASRARLLDLARNYGVALIFAGHLHVRHEVRTADGIRIVVTPGSARTYDDSPIGYRAYEVRATELEGRWQSVGSLVPRPWHVPGLREWTPRLVDFSVRHWFFTLLYAGTGAFALRAASRLKGRRAGEPKAWRGVAFAEFFFALNMQLDLDEFVQELGRIAVRLVGLAPLRHLISASMLCVGLVIAGAWLYRNAQSGRRSRPLLLSMLALGIPALWFALSMISHHDLGMILPDDTWDALLLASLAAVAGSALFTTKGLRAAHAP